MNKIVELNYQIIELNNFIVELLSLLLMNKTIGKKNTNLSRNQRSNIFVLDKFVTSPRVLDSCDEL